MAKWTATESAQEVIDAAVQMFGALGVTRGQVVERLYREIRALRIYEGATEVQKIVIARELLRSRTANNARATALAGDRPAAGPGRSRGLRERSDSHDSFGTSRYLLAR
jgi:hypothetical protein